MLRKNTETDRNGKSQTAKITQNKSWKIRENHNARGEFNQPTNFHGFPRYHVFPNKLYRYSLLLFVAKSSRSNVL